MARFCSYWYIYFIGVFGLRMIDSVELPSSIEDLRWKKLNDDNHESMNVTYDSGNPSSFSGLKGATDTLQKSNIPKFNEESPRTRANQLKPERDGRDLKFQKHNISFIQESGKLGPHMDYNGTSFEEYERSFLLNQIKNMLEQFLQFNNFRNQIKKNDQANADKSPKSTEVPSGQIKPTPSPQPPITTTSTVRTDLFVIEQAMNVLNQKDFAQLTQVFGSLTGKATHGRVDVRITDLCCILG